MIRQYYLEDKRDERYPDIYALGDMYSGLDFVFQHRYEKLATDMKRVFDETIASSGLDIMNMGRAWVILDIGNGITNIVDEVMWHKHNKIIVPYRLR